MNQILSSSSQITSSPQTDEPSFTTSTGFHSSAVNVRGWDEEEEEQGPRVFIEANGEGEKNNTLEAVVAGMGYTDGACCGDKIKNMMRFLCERRRGK